MLQDLEGIADNNLKKAFKKKVNEKIDDLEEQLENPITQTQKFILVLNNINNNSDVGDANIFVGDKDDEESLYWIFNSWKPDSQTEITKKLIQNGATYLANRLNQDVTTMNLRDIIQVLDFVINDFHHLKILKIYPLM